jgi:hypothetical protein
MLVCARLPDAFGPQDERYHGPTAAAFAPGSQARRSIRSKDAPIIVVAILLYYGAVLFVWLNFADYAPYWVPYRFYPLESAY